MAIDKTDIQGGADITELSRQWLIFRRDGDVAGIEVLPQQTASGLVVWFYYEETGQDLPYFLTVPMVNELLDGRNPKKARNEYEHRKDGSR